MTHPDPVQHHATALITECDRAAKQNSRRLENAGKLPHGYTDTNYGTTPAAELRDRWPSAARLNIAWQLAKDLQTLEQLLNGEPVDPTRIHADEMQRALEPRLVQLVRPIDVLQVRAA